MSDATANQTIRAALDLWETLAAFAWERQLTEGRGVVLIEQKDLMHGAEAARRGQTPTLELGYVSAAVIPQGDDFRDVILRADPSRQVVLLVRGGPNGGEQDEQLFVLETAANDRRPAPPDCHARSQGDAES